MIASLSYLFYRGFYEVAAYDIPILALGIDQNGYSDYNKK